MHSISSWTSEDPNLSCSYICLHYNLQHHFSSAPNILSPTRNYNEHKPHKNPPNPSCISPSNPIHYANISCPTLWDIFRPDGPKNHQKRFGYLSSPKGWDRAFYRDFLNGCSCTSGAQEKELGLKVTRKTINFLDCSTVSYFRAIRNVHSSRANWVFLQTVIRRDAILFNSYDLLLVLIRVFF